MKKNQKNAICCFEQILVATSHKNSCSAIYLPSQKPSKLEKRDILGTAGKAMTNSFRFLHMDVARVDRPVRIYMHHLYADTGGRLDDLPGTMDVREG